MLTLGGLGFLVLTAWLLRGVLSGRRDGPFSAPLLLERIDALFVRYEGQRPSAAEVEQLERDASRLFRDIITGLGYLPDDWSLRVHVDELLGPVPRLHGPEGLVLGLAVFDRGLRDGSLILPRP